MIRRLYILERSVRLLFAMHFKAVDKRTIQFLEQIKYMITVNSVIRMLV